MYIYIYIHTHTLYIGRSARLAGRLERGGRAASGLAADDLADGRPQSQK